MTSDFSILSLSNEFLEKLKKLFIRKKANKLELWKFSEENPQYHAFCGLFHIKYAILLLTIIKTIFILCYISSYKLSSSNEWFKTFNFCSIIIIIITHMFVIIGVIVKKYTFVIPYFTLCTLLIFVLMVKLFSDLISTANSKDTLEYNRLKILLLQSALLLLEVYTVIIVWRAFNYITDYIVHKDMFKKPPVGIRDPDVEFELLSRTLQNGNIELENIIPLRVLNSKTSESVHIPKVEKIGN